MKILLDTHTFLWSIVQQNLSERATNLFLDPDNELYLSAVSYWEICIKQSLGKLTLVENWTAVFDEAMTANRIKWLAVEKSHCQKIIELPSLHSDPFDRLLIAQALCEEMTLLTADRHIQRYAVPTMW